MPDQPIPEHRPIRDVVAELLTIEARAAGLLARGAALRQDLEARARRVKEQDGVASTWRSPGLGTASFSDPQPKVRVKDAAAFGSWVAQRVPEVCTATVVLPAEPAVLERALAALAEEDVPVASVVVDVDGGWTKKFAEGCAAVDEAPTDELFAPAGVTGVEGGSQVDGLHLAPAAPGSLSVRLDPEAKARAIAELADRPVVAGVVGSAPLVDESVMDADGEPDYDAAAAPVRDFAADMVEALEQVAAADEAQTFGLVAGTRLESLKVSELRPLLVNRHLPLGGNKPDLIERLRAWAQAQDQQVPA